MKDERKRIEYHLAPCVEQVDAATQAILEQARDWGLADERAQFDLHVAVEEALANAMFHGALEIEPEFRERGVAQLLAETKARAGRPPYVNRRIVVEAERLDDAVRISINDGGPGFDISRVPAADTQAVGGRGLMLIRSFVDAVEHNASGNQITLLKRFSTSDRTSAQA